MAATKLIAMHVNKGKTVAQCLKARTDYAKDEDKTEENSYEDIFGSPFSSFPW